jgi:hypothetical protein
MDFKKLEKTAVDYAAYRIKDSLLTLISDITEPNINNDLFAPSNKLNSLKQEITEIYSLLEDAIDDDKEARTKLLDRLTALNNEIIEYAVRINGYTCCCNQLGDYLTNIYQLNDVKKMANSLELDNVTIAEKIHSFAHKQANDSEGNFKLAKIMQSLPLRMTKDKYNDYVAGSVKALLSALPEEMGASTVSRLKTLFHSPASNEMKSEFPFMYERITEIYKLDSSELTNETIEEYLASLDDNIETLAKEYETLSVYYTDVNYLTIIVNYCVDSEFMFDNDIMLKDLFYAVNNYINNKDENLKNEIYERCINEIENRYEAAKPMLDSFKKEASQLKDDEINDSLQVFLSVCLTVDNYFYSELNNAIMLYDKPDNTDTLVAQLLDYINTSTADMPREQQKQLKQHFLSQLPTSYTPDQLSEYARYALDGVRSKETAILSYMLIFEILEPETETEHTHSDNCGCGHEHHHNDCECGHEHHHNDCGCGHEHHH